MRYLFFLITILIFGVFTTSCENESEKALCKSITCGENASCNTETGKCDCDTGYAMNVNNICTANIIDLCADTTCDDENSTCNSETGTCDCNTNFTLENGLCVAIDLCENIICDDENSTCNSETGNCDCNTNFIPENGVCTRVCIPDQFLDNNTSETASPITEGVYENLTLCGKTDEDWYEITITKGEVLNFEIFFTDSYGDIELKLYDNEGNLLKNSTSNSDNEKITFLAEKSGVYKINIYSSLSFIGNIYSINYSTETFQCDADEFEENNTSETAASILKGSHENLTLCSESDEDWYEIALTEGEVLNFEILFTDDNGDINLELYNNEGNILKSSRSTSDNEKIIFLVEETGIYRLRINSLGSNFIKNNYTINYSAEPFQCEADEFEINNTSETAATLSDGRYENLTLCSKNDEDWYKIALTEGEVLNFEILFSDDNGNIDLKLYDNEGNDLKSSTSFSDNEKITFLVEETGIYKLKINPTDSSIDNDFLKNTYTINYSAEPFQCETDEFDANNTSETAAPLSYGTYENLTLCNKDDEDWYEIALTAGEILNFEVLFTDDNGDIDLRLYDNEGNRLKMSMTISDNENITFLVKETGIYKLRVDATGSYFIKNNYTINYSILSDFCPSNEQDQFDINNTSETAASLNAGTYENLTLCSDIDEDWYEISLTEGEILNFEILFTDDNGNIDLRLYDNEGNRLKTSTSGSDNENITFLVEETAVYRLKVNAAGSFIKNTYTINYSASSDFCPSDEQDEFDINNTSETAAPLNDGTYENLTLCSDLDEDWYEISLTEGEILNFEILFTDDNGNIDLKLYDNEGNSLKSSTSTSDNEKITYLVEETGIYKLKIDAISGFSINFLKTPTQLIIQLTLFNLKNIIETILINSSFASPFFFFYLIK